MDSCKLPPLCGIRSAPAQALLLETGYALEFVTKHFLGLKE